MTTATESPVIAGPLGDCCFTGVKHEGDPVGKTVTIGPMETYISEPAISKQGGQKKIILYLADVYGPLYLNAQLLQDYFAANGYLVLGPDYFFGDGIGNHTEPDFDRAAWFEKSRKQSREAFPVWVKAIKEKYGSDATYYAVGYCFGAPFAIELAADNEVAAAAFAHPAMLTEDHFQKLKKPLLLSCAETDHTFPAEFRRRAEDIMVENKASYHIQVFSGVSHGFATRGDPTVENSRWAKEECARSVINWFNRFSK